MKRSKWINSAKRRRIHAKFRRNLCRILGCPTDTCYSTGELLRDARASKDVRHQDRPSVQVKRIDALGEYDAFPVRS